MVVGWPHHVWEFVFIYDLHVVQLDVHVLVHRMQCSIDCQVILELDSDLDTIMDMLDGLLWPIPDCYESIVIP